MIVFLFGVVVALGGGFDVFHFDDAPDEVMDSGKNRCSFDRLQMDTRWPWKSYLSCTDYDFKGVKTKLYFEFNNNELQAVYVVSIDIADYRLIKHLKPKHLVAKNKGSKKLSSNLADQLIFQDKVYVFDKGKQRTDFFYNGKWEWELKFSDLYQIESDLDRQKSLLKNEEDGAVTEWKNYSFGEKPDITKSKLEGFCEKLEASTFEGSDGNKLFVCKGYPFVEQKIQVRFLFFKDALVKIELDLDPKWYETLLPQLKTKYGKPYIELYQSRLFYSFIEFPKFNVVMRHKIDPQSQGLRVYLEYSSQEFMNSNLPSRNIKPDNKLKRKKTQLEKIQDNI